MPRNSVRPARLLVAAASILSLVGVAVSPAQAAAGDLDPTFGGDGIVTTDFGGYDSAAALAIQPDGKLVVAGYTSGQTDDAIVARYKANGGLDSTFSTDGIAATDFGGYDAVSAVAVQDDGKIVVAGHTSGQRDDSVVARFNANGSRDTGFGNGGVVITDLGGYDALSAIAVQADGKIVVAGHTFGANENAVVARYNANGTLDNSFGGDGIVTTDLGGYDSASALAIQDDGKLVIAGMTFGQTEDAVLARYNANGNLDNGFSGDGIVTTDLGGYDSAAALAIQDDGKLVIAGSTFGENDDAVVARYEPNGGATPAPNASPTVTADTRVTPVDQPVEISVLANDSDSNGDALSITSVSTPAHGTATISGPRIRYVPATGFAGVDSFTYKVSDGRGGSATGTVTVTVQRPSDGVDIDAATTVESAPQATPALPVAVAVTSPNAGRVSITEAPASAAPSGFSVIGRHLRIEAPAATAANPLRLTFRVERSVLEAAGGSPSTVSVFRNGVAAAECPASTTAVPDPCIAGRSIDATTDDVVVVVLAAHASDWALGVELPGPKGDGYWMLGRDGKVYNFGEAARLGDPSAHLSSGASFVDLEPTPSGDGYWVADNQGRLYAYNATQFANVTDLARGEEVTSVSSTKGGKGLWVFTNRGRVIVRGDAKHHGDMAGVTLNGPVLDSIIAPDRGGYYMVASDGGVFSFGTARFEGSMGGQRLNAPVQSLVPDPDGSGYWLVASDGGVFSFAAAFRGSTGSTRLNKPMTGMVPYGTGYLMVAEDGGIFDFSPDKDFLGSLGNNPPAVPIVSVAIH
ncbi:MAG TPA: Ig-like domain-containing protein [Acidimicrobiia bacterium]|nr:Ig-like domain-containing protein [Acidimicrobiia bacterium]